MGHHHRLLPESSDDQINSSTDSTIKPDRPNQSTPVTVPLSALESQSDSPIPKDTLLSAFGPSSLGILIVSNLPPHFPALRSRVLRSISHLAHLPQSTLNTLTNENAKYLVGWSHGKESLRPGVVDTMKGSYYVNCAFDSSDPVLERMRQNWAGFEEYTAPNVWPEEDVNKQLEGFRKDVEELIALIVDVAGLVARAVDGFAEENVENYPVPTTEEKDNKKKTGYLESVVRNSRTSKARLLHYFPSPSPPPSSSPSASDSWCATHKDHSCLTGLTSAAFFDESPSSTSSSEFIYAELPTSPSPTAGLYILDRHSQIHKVSIPRDCLAFQTGEALERITQGKLKAVPHFVRGVDDDNDNNDNNEETGKKNKSIARNTLAVFTQPNLDDVVDLTDGLTFGEFARGIVRKNTTS